MSVGHVRTSATSRHCSSPPLWPMLDARDVMPGHYSFTLLDLPLIATAAITLGLGLYALLKRRIAGAGTFAVVMFGVVEWSLCYALVLAGTDRDTKLFWYQAEYLGVSTIPTLWLLFALRYSRWQRWLGARTLAVLAIEPVLALTIVWTNGTHGLMWPTVDIDTTTNPSVLDLTFGVGYWFNTIYSYVL